MAPKGKSVFIGKVASNAQKQQSAGTSYGHLKLPKDIPIFKEDPECVIDFDILPYIVTDKRHPDRDTTKDQAVPGQPWYRRPYKLHKNVGANNESFVCPTSFGEPCPICEHRALRFKATDVTKDELKELRPKDRNLYVIIPIGVKKTPEDLHIYDSSHHLFQKKLIKELVEKPQYEAFCDLEEGYTLHVRFESESIDGGKAFGTAGRIDFEKRKEQYDPAFIDEIPNLDEILIHTSYEELKAAFLEVEDIDEEEETPAPPSRASRHKVPVAAEPEEAEEPAPPRKRKVTEPEPVPARSRRRAEPEPEPEVEENPEEVDPIICPVCKGTGKNSKGKPCVTCDGTGYLQEEEVEEDPEPEPEPAPVRKPAKPIPGSAPKTGKTVKASLTCPSGHVFGRDCEKFDECDVCDLWTECAEAKDSKK